MDNNNTNQGNEMKDSMFKDFYIHLRNSGASRIQAKAALYIYGAEFARKLGNKAAESHFESKLAVMGVK